MRYVRSWQPKGSHNQSLEISFRRAAEKGEISPWLHYPDNSRVRGPKHSTAPPPLFSLLPPRPPFASRITASSFSTPASLNTPVSRARKPYMSRCRLHLTPFSLSPLRLPVAPLPPRRTADARIIAAKPYHKAVPHHKGLFNP